MDNASLKNVAPPVATLLTTVALFASQFCGERRPHAPAPAVAAASDRYTVAWMRPAKDGGALVVQQFSRTTLKALAAPRVVIERNDLREGGVELVSIDSGYLAISRVQDPEKRPNWATQIVTVPLDPNGNPSGDEHTFAVMDYACHGAGVIGGRIVMAYKQVARSERYPNDVLGVLVVDRSGGYQGDRVIAKNPVACATAVSGREIAVAWTRRNETKSGRPTVGLNLSFEDPYRGGRHETFVVPVGTVDAGPVRIVRHASEWAILYSASHGHLHLAIVDTHGSLLGTRDLPREIDRATVDLSTNARGMFVTWIDDGRVRSLGVGGAPRSVKAAGSQPSETRAFGDDASCLVGWTVDRGKAGRIAKLPACP